MELGYPGTPEAEVLEEPQSEEHENLPNTPSVITAPKRKNFTLRSALKNVVENKEANQETIKVLQNIDDNLGKLVQIQQKRLEIEQVRLQMKYPDVTFISNEEADGM